VRCGPRISPGNDARPVTELPGRTVNADRREFDDRVRALLSRLCSAVPVELGVGVAVVGDLRRTAAEHPSDPAIKALVDELNLGSPRFAQLWSSGAVGTHAESRKTIEHPEAGDVAVDCDVLAVPGSGQHVVAYTAATGSVAADRLDFVRATAGLARRVPSADQIPKVAGRGGSGSGSSFALDTPIRESPRTSADSR
jgi:hypothetical protein